MVMLRTVATLPIRFYRYFVSPLLPAACRFYPSCSTYAEEAILQHGIFRGGIYTLWRIVRCNPWCAGGYDPVPKPASDAQHRKF